MINKTKPILFFFLLLSLISKISYSADSTDIDEVQNDLFRYSKKCIDDKLYYINVIQKKIEAQKESIDKKKLNRYYMQLAFSFQELSDYYYSIYYGLKCLPYFEKLKGKESSEIQLLLFSNYLEINKIWKLNLFLDLHSQEFAKQSINLEIKKYYLLSQYYTKKGIKDSSLLFFIKYRSLIKLDTFKPENCLQLSKLYFSHSKYLMSKKLMLKIFNSGAKLNCIQKIKYNLELAKVYLALEMPDSAKKYIPNSEIIEKNFPENILKSKYYSIKKIYYAQKDSFKQAYLYSENQHKIENILNHKYINLNIEYISRKVYADIVFEQNLDLRSDNRRKKLYIFTMSGLLLLILFAGIYFYLIVHRNRTLNKKLLLSNEKLKTYSEVIMERALEQERLNAEISAMHSAYKAQILEKDKVSERLKTKSKAMVDSLFYARNIQKALFPQGDMITNKNNFILWRPKDVVSGDFYWFHRIGNYYYVAVGDCTGHGVPGAFMSILGISYLNDIIAKHGILPPSKILDLLNQKILNSLNQKGATQVLRDGMDIALIMISLKSNIGFFSGAYNNLYIVHKEDKQTRLHELKADRRPIGLYGHYDKYFTEQRFTIKQGDLIYLTTDGYADQFGGNRQKKFMKKRFREFLLKITDYPTYIQKILLNEKFISWKGKNEQLDDVLIIGIKI